MKYYLSSFRMGNNPHEYISLSNGPKVVAYIANAIDYVDDINLRNMIFKNDIDDLNQLGLRVVLVDLRDYFNSNSDLEEIMNDVGYIWITGGNGFVLNRAYKLSGFDKLLHKYMLEGRDIVYGGFSCATYVLSDCLYGYELVDDINVDPYGDDSTASYDGVGLIDYKIIPHYQSEHHESEQIEEVLKYMKSRNIDYRLLRDGEVIII